MRDQEFDAVENARLEGSHHRVDCSGRRLAAWLFTCRSCGRIFDQTTINSRTWAVDNGRHRAVRYGDELDGWPESCARRPGEGDEDNQQAVQERAYAVNPEFFSQSGVIEIEK